MGSHSVTYAVINSIGGSAVVCMVLSLAGASIAALWESRKATRAALSVAVVSVAAIVLCIVFLPAA